MSIIAGIYSMKRGVGVPSDICDDLKASVSRNVTDERIVFADERSFFVKVDLGAFVGAGHYNDDEGNITLLAGEPLIDNGGEDRSGDLITIRAEFATENYSVLNNSRGVFCLADHNGQSGRLRLATDKLGIRPLYYWHNGEILIFASALRILESISFIPKRMDVRAVTEIASLGYALADRTPYCDIFVLRAGEILEVKDSVISHNNYARWNEIPCSDADENEILNELFKRFETAVSVRIGSDDITTAYLSGGLDSRCVVAALCRQNVKVHTFNFARANTQDQLLGRFYAEKADVLHTELPKRAGDQVPDYSTLMANASHGSSRWLSMPPQRPSVVWSGEGGSVDLGHVHLAGKIVEYMRDGNEEAAIDEFMRLEDIYLSPKLLKSGLAIDPSEMVRKGIREELDKISSFDAARRFYLFLMLNDQRRKLAGHFENNDLHRLEFQLPFFDSSFVEFIVSIPVDLCIEHKLYVKWLGLFPNSVREVAWQSYPGHEPCPLPVPDGFSYQWDEAYQAEQRSSLKHSLIDKAKTMLRAKNFPAEILSKRNIRLAVLAHRTGIRDYGYVIETAAIFYGYWVKCNGEFSIAII